MELNDSGTPPPETDEELADRVRGGDVNAFGVLWERHAGPALSVARGFRGLDADDIVSEAFERLLTSLQKGKGPRGAFRPYLIATVRNVGRKRYQREALLQDADFDLMIDPDAIDGEHAAIHEQHRQAAEEAFNSLPPRWRAALWYSEVDGLPPREMSAPLGLSSNAVSALVARAKRRFRDAWVSAQLSRADSAECRAVIADIGAYTRDGLAPRATRKVEAHVATCASCAAALKEAQKIAQTLAMAILPAVAGAVGGAGYLSTMRPPAMPEIALPVTTAAAGEAGIEDDGAPAAPKPRLVVAYAVSLTILGGVVIGGALAGLAPSSPVRQIEPGQPAVPRLDAAGPPTPTEPLAPGSSPPAETAPPHRQEGPVAGHQRLPAALPPEPAPEAGPPAAVVASLIQADERLYPRASGNSAAPGASIHVADSDGTIVATTTADGLGRWLAAIRRGPVGTSSVSVTQAVGGITSPASPALTYTVTAPPAATHPMSGDVVDAARFAFRMRAPAGSAVQRSVVGHTPVQTLIMPSSGLWNEYLALPPGDHVLRLRWADPLTGDYGPWSEIRFTAR